MATKAQLQKQLAAALNRLAKTTAKPAKVAKPVKVAKTKAQIRTEGFVARLPKFAQRREFNRTVLVPALKAADITPNGKPWDAAKAVIAKGGTVKAAVAAAAKA